MKLIFAAAVLLASAGVSFAQDRGSIPPGASQDGSSPADGALKGGSIQPGERSGVPERDISRCKDLTGTLREQCLRDAQPASGGAAPLPRPDPNVRDPRLAPPPQNPR